MKTTAVRSLVRVVSRGMPLLTIAGLAALAACSPGSGGRDEDEGLQDAGTRPADAADKAVKRDGNAAPPPDTAPGPLDAVQADKSDDAAPASTSDAASGKDTAGPPPGGDPSPGAVLYETDFSKALGAVLPSDPNWPLCDGALCPKKGDASIFFTNGAGWTNYVAEVSAFCAVGGPTLYVRTSDAKRGYGFEVKWDGNTWVYILWRYGDTNRGLKSGRISADKATLSLKWFRIRLQVNGAEITASLQKEAKTGAWQELARVTDETYAKGGIGLKMHAIGDGKFDDLVVRALP